MNTCLCSRCTYEKCEYSQCEKDCKKEKILDSRSENNRGCKERFCDYFGCTNEAQKYIKGLAFKGTKVYLMPLRKKQEAL